MARVEGGLVIGRSSGGRRLLCAIARVVKRADEGRGEVRVGGRRVCVMARVEGGLVMGRSSDG